MDSKNYAVVTGATSGIGAELAKLVAEAGYKLILVGRNADELENKAIELENQFNIDVITLVRDLSVRKEVLDLCEDIRHQNVQIDILINDAGQGQYGQFVDTNLDRELKIIDLNIISVVILTKHFLKDMVSRGNGRILNLSSVASKIPGPWQSVYHGTKAFIQSFTEAVRSEVKDSGVTITALLPGPTDTDFFNKADMLDSKAVQDGKLADAAKVAKDGFDALMEGKDMVVSGLGNKAQVMMANILPDHTVADQVNKQQEPKD